MTDYVLDIETTTDHKTVRLIGVLDCYSNPFTYLKLKDTDDFIRSVSGLAEGDRLITWNGTRFDLDVLSTDECDLNEMLSKQGVKHIDAMLLAKLHQPDHKGGHSLKAWMDDLCPKKYAHKEFSSQAEKEEFYNTAPLSDLVPYNHEDLKGTYEVFQKLEYLMKDWNWDHALRIEQEVAWLTNKQKKKMVHFDIPKAHFVLSFCNAQMQELEDDINAKLPPLPIPSSKLHYPPKKQFLKDGTPSKLIENYLDKYNCTLRLEHGIYNVYQTLFGSPMNFLDALPIVTPVQTHDKVDLGQTTRIKEYLLSLGWKPTEYNTKVDPPTGKKVPTSPLIANKVTKEPCPNLRKLGIDWVEDLSRWYTVRSRRNLLLSPKGTGLIPTAQKQGGYIASDADTLGTPTARYRHKGIVNIPRVSTALGKEIRELFSARAGMNWVGWDASGLEAAIEAHYTHPFDPDYAEMLVSGSSDLGTDVHTQNYIKLGLPSRDIAKNFKYGITYGAQPKKLSNIMDCGLIVAEHRFHEFWELNVGLREFKEQLTRQWKASGKKYIIGLDGRRIYTRSEHALLNSCFQAGGAILMKHAMLIMEGLVAKSPLFTEENTYGLIRYHDEEQWETSLCNSTALGELGVKSIEMAGKYLQLRVPITGEYKVGNNWAETH